MSGIERVRVVVPAGFDSAKARHMTMLMTKVGDQYGEGFNLDHIDREPGENGKERLVAVVVRQAAVTEVQERNDLKVINLGRGIQPNEGDKWATKMADTYPGWTLIDFDPWNGRATLAQMTPEEIRCRGALANAMMCKPWDVKVKSSKGGGYDVRLPNSYVGSKHDTKIDEVATTVVGRFGWYVVVDSANLVAKIIPSAPPTFPEVLPLDKAKLGKGNPDRSPFGLKLPNPGEKAKDMSAIDWNDQSFALVSGLPGGGKTVMLNSLIADQLSNGAQLVIVDETSKSVDFEWAKEFVRDGGWGCDSLRQSVTALALMYEEGQRRADILRARGINNWINMPKGERFVPILAVVDEVSALLVTDRLPAGVDKKQPEVQEIIEMNLLKFRLQRLIFKIISQQRFVGMRMILSTQVTNNNTGLPPTLKSLIGHKLLLGPNPSPVQRKQAFNVESNVPVVPENLRGGGLVTKGIGSAELEGQNPFVFKTFFATPDALREELVRLKIRRTSRPEPTDAEMDRLCPLGEEADDEEVEETSRSGGREHTYEDWELGEDGRPLTGYERANAARHAAGASAGKPTPKQRAEMKEEAAAAAKSGPVLTLQADECPYCSGYINPATGVCPKCGR